MNALLNLWGIIATLTASLTRTNELVQTMNGRMERSLGMNEPEDMLAIESEPVKKGKK